MPDKSRARGGPASLREHARRTADRVRHGKFAAARPRMLAFGIDETTALEEHADTCAFLGRGDVRVFQGDPGKPLRVLKDGARFDLRRVAVL